MQEIWNIDDIEQATHASVSGIREGVSVTSVSIDSRTIQPGALFIALKGEHFDGHQFVESAFEQGAVAVLVNQDQADGFNDETKLIIAVEDTEKALVDLGLFRRKQSQARFVGVTGSVGKTSVKEMLRAALSVHGITYATEGNLNNHLGTPLSLARIPLNVEFAVMEMGMNHGGEIAYLTKMVKPNVSIITTVEAVHLENFESLQGIADAKAEIFLGHESGGVAVLNKDNQFFDYLVQKAGNANISEVIAFGEDDQSECCMSHYDEKTQTVTLENNLDDSELEYVLGIRGKHQALNSCGVLAVVNALGLDMSISAKVFADYKAQKGRGEMKTIPTSFGMIHVIDDCYNAGPASVKAAVKTVLRHDNGRVIAVLGDMLELGETSKQLHESLKEEICQSNIDQVFTVGSQMKHLFEALPANLQAEAFSDINAAIEPISKMLEDNDTVLIKGSNGMKMRLLVDALHALIRTPTESLA
ncbi:MAG: UDP-N-acetylmuramoyl-tripeptide--D-alanyl-D-alanine ligase, partial [Rickettsiales bacterium]|nr:UDP-N-acetylmuramoyl-tripeptide--D-alanyl-D-alanine ligase [Rickettsiales bacterium]